MFQGKATWLSAEGRAELIQYMLEKSGLSVDDIAPLERLISIEITDAALKQKGKSFIAKKSDWERMTIDQ